MCECQSFCGNQRREIWQDQDATTKNHTCPAGLGTKAVAGMLSFGHWREGGEKIRGSIYGQGATTKKSAHPVGLAAGVVVGMAPTFAVRRREGGMG